MKRHHKHFSLGLGMVFAALVAITAIGGGVNWLKAASYPPSSLLFDSDRTGNYEIYKVTPNGAVSQLTSGGSYDSWWPKPSPDGKTFIFYRTPKGVHDGDYQKTSLWKANIDGTNAVQLIAAKANGWSVQGHAEWLPDGSGLLMFGGNAQLYTTSVNGTNPQLINVIGQPSAITDPSISNDGSRITYARGGDIWTVARTGGTPTQITSDQYIDYDPYFSPDGKQIAFLTHTSSNLSADWAIRMANKDGSNLHNFISDGHINSKPAWSQDGSLIYFHRHPTGSGTGFFGLWMQTVQGGTLTALSVGNGANEYPAVILATPTATNPQAPTTPVNSGTTKTGATTGSPGTHATEASDDGTYTTNSGGVDSSSDNVAAGAVAGITSSKPPLTAQQKRNLRFLLVPLWIAVGVGFYFMIKGYRNWQHYRAKTLWMS